MRTSSYCMALACFALCAGCATTRPAGRPDEWRTRLAGAMAEDVTTRQDRDRLSKVMVDAVDAGALEGLSMADVESAFGRGASCDGNKLCDQNGFGSGDWYYSVGHTTEPSIKQMPILIVGFTSHQYVGRVFTLKTH